MNAFDDYIRGKGDAKCPNPQAREIIAAKMKTQGLVQVYSPPLPPMTFRLFEEDYFSGNVLKIKYWLAWRGR